MLQLVLNRATRFVVAVLLTGMGDDGARCLKELKDCGANTIAQDEESCVVFGMPNAAIKLGAAKKVMNLEQIITELRKVK